MIPGASAPSPHLVERRFDELISPAIKSIMEVMRLDNPGTAPLRDAEDIDLGDGEDEDEDEGEGENEEEMVEEKVGGRTGIGFLYQTTFQTLQCVLYVLLPYLGR